MTPVLALAVASAGIVGVLVALPVLPTADLGPVLALNADVAETIGWPDLARTVAGVQRELPGHRRAVILTRNYGEAAAIDRYGPALGLPRAFSGHNAYWNWGPPPDAGAPVIAVGMRPDTAAAYLRDCRVTARIANRAGVDNTERGRFVLVCRGPRRRCSVQWPRLRRLG